MHHPPEESAAAPRIAIVGGGIAGLAAAHRLTELDPSLEISLFEADARLGGVLHTEHIDGYLLEHSADSFITSTPGAIELCRRIGFAEQLISTDERYRRAFVVRAGRLVPVPEGFMLLAPRRLWPVLTSPILSFTGKLRLLCEAFVPRRTDIADESLASFARRRLGRQAYERLAQPLAGGIYTGDAEQLSLAATLPRFLEMERRHGSLIRGARAEAAAAPEAQGHSGARYALFVAPRDGMTSLVEALASRLPLTALRLGSRIEHLALAAHRGWRLRVQADGSPSEEFDGLIVACPAHQAARLFSEVDPALSDALEGIPYADSALALVGYRREQIGHPLDGAGLVVPEVEQRQILACSFSSQKFPGRAPPGHVLLRVFLGGPRQPEVCTWPDDRLQEIVCRELADLLQARGEPQLFRVARWRQAMPQYHLGHRDRIARIEARVAAQPGMELAGNALRGVGIPDCIRSGEVAAQRLLEKLKGVAGG